MNRSRGDYFKKGRKKLKDFGLMKKALTNAWKLGVVGIDYHVQLKERIFMLSVAE